jgi:plastocyanin
MTRTLRLAFAAAAWSLCAGVQAQAVVEVTIQKNTFVPERIEVKRGATVRWTNAERRTTHSILFPAENLESERLLPGEAWERRFERPGTYPYTCGPHPEMKGVIVVTD